MMHDRCLERKKERKKEKKKKKQGRDNSSCHFSDEYFLPCFLCKHPTIFFQNKNRIF